MVNEQRIARMKALWQQCFHDDPQWVECFYRHFSPATTCQVATNGDEVVSTLYSVGRFRFTCMGETTAASYLYALCTHPDFRAKGWMGSLITKTLRQLYREAYGVAVLIPAEAWLFDYYARYGFSPVFRRQRLPLTAPDAPSAAGWSLFTPTTAEAIGLLQRTALPAEGQLRHTHETWEMVMDDLHLSNGLCLGVRQNRHAAEALALLYPEDDGWLIRHEAADTPEATEALHRQLLARWKGVPLSTYLPATDAAPGTPFGMIRVLSAQRLLQAYARQHPEADMAYLLTDAQIEENNGLFRLKQGVCEKEDSSPDITACHTLDIGQLAEELLAPLHPYMSVMWE